MHAVKCWGNVTIIMMIEDVKVLMKIKLKQLK